MSTEEQQLTVHALAQTGEGIATAADGATWFVPGGLPGDRVQVTTRELRKGSPWALAHERLGAGPARVPSYCQVSQCGGCSWRELEPQAARTHKRDIVREALRRIAKIEADVVAETLAGPELGYRHRVRLHAHGQDIGYRMARSHRPLAFRECPVVRPAFAERLAKLAKYLGQAGVVYGEIEATAGDDDRVVIELEPDSRRDFDAMVEAVRKQVDAGTLAGAIVRPAPGAKGVRERRMGETWVALRHPSFAAGAPRFALEPGVFSQANWASNGLLTAAVAQAVPLDAAVVEWHAGAGNLTLAYAGHARKVVASEIAPFAAMCARRNIEAHGLASKVSVLELGDGEAARRSAEWQPGVVVLDPPRQGALSALQTLVHGAHVPARIVYVSCDPGSLARDVAALMPAYRLTSVQPIDMFPGTPHIECVAVLDRG